MFYSIFQIYFPENSKHRLANGHVDRIIPAIKNVFASRSGEASSARPFRIRCRKILCFHTEKVPLGGLIKLLIFNLFGKQVTVGAQGCERKGGRAKKWISMEWSERCEYKTRLCKCRNRLFAHTWRFCCRQVQHSRLLSRPVVAALVRRHLFDETLLYVDSLDRKSLLRNFDSCCQHVLEFHR